MTAGPSAEPRNLERLLAQRLQRAWWHDPRVELLSGLVVALALIPEAISFSIIAGVDPKVGLYASFSIAIIISIAGGRSGMISAATGAMALVVVPLVEEHGVAYCSRPPCSPVRSRWHSARSGSVRSCDSFPGPS